MTIHRRSLIAALLAGVALDCLALPGGLALAAERPSQSDIVNALKPAPRTRALTLSPQQAEEEKFIQGLRTIKTRQLTVGERQKVSTIAKERPSIDLEIYFDYNSAAISPKAAPDLNTLGRALTDAQLEGDVFLVAGHTDAKGSDAYNQMLSERRAQSVKRWLMQRYKLPEDRLVAAGYGEEQLKNTANPFAAENRRVQITNLGARQTAGH